MNGEKAMTFDLVLNFKAALDKLRLKSHLSLMLPRRELPKLVSIGE